MYRCVLPKWSLACCAGAAIVMTETRREYDQLKTVADTGRYKIRLTDDEPFLPGIKGQVEPYSLDGQTLAAFTDKPSVLKQLLALPFVKHHQVGQTEGSVLFHVTHFSEMVDFLKLRKKRPRPTDAQIARGRAALKVFHTRPRPQNVGQKPTNGGASVSQHERKKCIRLREAKKTVTPLIGRAVWAPMLCSTVVFPVERREACGPYAWQRRNKRVYSQRRYLVGTYVMMMRVRENPLLLWEGLE